ncbi:MAG: AzlC family ABC transporter permease [Halobacteriales archaeon]
MATPREDFLSGVKAFAPVLLGIIPFGMVSGVAAVTAGFTGLQALGMSLIVFAGASQLAAIELIRADAPAAIIVLTAVIVNVRLMMYSASLAPYFRSFSRLRKWLCAYLLTDPAFALSITEFTADETTDRLWYYLGTTVPGWVMWQVGTVVGILLGVRVPPEWQLEFAVPLVFMTLLFGAIEDRATAGAAIVAGIVAIGGAAFPFNLGLPTAALLGIAAGLTIERREAS